MTAKAYSIKAQVEKYEYDYIQSQSAKTDMEKKVELEDCEPQN